MLWSAVLRSEDTIVEEGAVPVGVVECLTREARVEERADRSLDDLDVVVGGIEDGLGEVVRVDDERVPDAHRHDLAAGAVADAAIAVVAGLGRIRGAARPVVARARVARGVVGVVVVVEEVPAGDVVDVAVRVGVGAVAEDGDQVAGVEDRVGLGVAGGDRRHAESPA